MSKRKSVAKGTILWVDEEIVGYECECGEEITVDIYGEEDDLEFSICPNCGRNYRLVQTNTVYEIKDGEDE